MSNKTTDARKLALDVLLAVIQQGESLSSSLPKALLKSESTKDKAFTQMLVYGVLRWYWQLQAILTLLVKKPLKQKDLDIQLILLLSLYQLIDTRVPEYAAVDAAVKLAKKQKKNWAAGLINAVLRNYVREKTDIEKRIQSKPQAVFMHPQWMIDRIKKDWPDNWQNILQQNNHQAPMSLRINQQKINIEKYTQQIDNIKSMHEECIILDSAKDVSELPGFEQGWVSVQDAAAQKAAHLLDLKDEHRVLDCCSAPGGKTCHILETNPSIELQSVDASEQRLSRVQDNLDRLELSAELICGDATTSDWWDGQQYDRILLDVPCSASGVIRRHPDIKVLRRQQDIEHLVQTQALILKNIWQMLKPGGKLLYATCSIFKDENENQIADFLAHEKNAEEIAIGGDWGETRQHGKQIFPGDKDMDGFFYALIQKK